MRQSHNLSRACCGAEGFQAEGSSPRGPSVAPPGLQKLGLSASRLSQAFQTLGSSFATMRTESSSALHGQLTLRNDLAVKVGQLALGDRGPPLRMGSAMFLLTCTPERPGGQGGTARGWGPPLVREHHPGRLSLCFGRLLRPP